MEGITVNGYTEAQLIRLWETDDEQTISKN